MAQSMTEGSALTMLLRHEEERLLARRIEVERELDAVGRRLQHIRALLGSTGELEAAVAAEARESFEAVA